MSIVPNYIPDVTFHMRERFGKNKDNFRWVHRTSSELFSGKRVIILGVPAAFSPVCTDDHLPGYEKHFLELYKLGVDEVWCTSVNDAFVMFQWAKSLGIKHVKMLPDGNGEFAQAMGMLVSFGSKGYGNRSWRYVTVINDLRVEALFEEPGKARTNPSVDPLTVTGARQDILRYLEQHPRDCNHHQKDPDLRNRKKMPS